MREGVRPKTHAFFSICPGERAPPAQELRHIRDGRPGGEHGLQPRPGEGRDILLPDAAAAEEDHVRDPLALEQGDHLGDQIHLALVEEAQAHRVHLLGDDGVHDLAGGLAKAGEDHLEALVPEALSDLLGVPVMAAQAGLGDEDTHLQFSFHSVALRTGEGTGL